MLLTYLMSEYRLTTNQETQEKGGIHKFGLLMPVFCDNSGLPIDYK